MNDKHPLLIALKYIGLNIFYPGVTMETALAFIGCILSCMIIVAQIVCFVLLIVSLIKSWKRRGEEDE